MAFCAACGASVPGGSRFCPACGAAVAERPAEEERKLATVLFADLVGSTALADSSDAERTRALLTRFYDAMAAEITDAGGNIEKFIGDAVMAAFGAPTALEDHADRAMHAALSMQHTLASMFGETLKLRIGVNTGEVIVGQARAGSSFVSGDVVNVAARLEQAAQPGQILVGERAVSAVRKQFAFGAAMRVEAKGKPDGVRCRLLVRAPSPAAIGQSETGLVGRERELAALEAAYERTMAEDRPQLVAVIGEPGIGKTALLLEFWRRLAEKVPAPARRVGRCLAFGQAGAYAPLREVVLQHPQLLERRPILRLTLGRSAPPGLHPLEVGQQLNAAWAELISELTEDGPAAVLIEDLHWAESELLDLLDQARLLDRGKLLLVGTARDKPEGEWETIQLEALPSAEAGRLADTLARTELPQDLKTVLVERAGGNPFFLEELMRIIADRDISAELTGDLVVPDTVQAILAGRIDLLGQREKAALQAAAVVGRAFEVAPLRALIEEEPRIDALVERGFIRENGRGFTFMHALTREVAYGSLTTHRRAHLHAGYADWLERTGGGKDEDAAVLAHHYAEAVRPGDEDLAWPGQEDELGRLRASAVDWLRRAGSLAVGRYEMREAVALLERAVELEPDPGARLEIWCDIAHANVLYFDGRGFAAALQEGIALAADEETTADLYAELAIQTIGRAGMWGTPPPTDQLEGWVGHALELGGRDSAARAKALTARCYYEYEKSAEDAAEASRIADRLGDPVLRSRAYDARSLVAFVHGDYDQALEWCRRRIAIAGELDDPDMEASVFSSAAPPAAASGRFDEARQYAARQDEITRSLSPHHRLHGVSGILELDELLGNWTAVVELQQAVEQAVAANIATPCVRNARSLLVCALARAYRGEEDEAARLEREGEAHAMTGYGTVLDTLRLRLALNRGDLSAVKARLGTPAVRMSNWFYLSSMSAHLDGLAELGERARVEEQATRALRPGTYLEPFALRALGIARGDAALVERAASLFDALGLSWHVTRTAELL
jgi:class 3 adenylate cyclase/tetratricopeptide (TPR) repeat protein